MTAVGVAKTTKRGLHADGAGLYLKVRDEGTKSWVFRFMLDRKARAMGLGALHTVSLAEAREAAGDCRKLLLKGVDPIKARNAEWSASHVEAALQAAKAKTFSDCAVSYLEANESGWKNAKHRQQWQNTLDTYAAPVIGHLPVSAVDTALVLDILKPIWSTKTETASRVRGRIEAVLDWAKVSGYREGENPARWKGHLDHSLPPRRKVKKVKHHPALPYNRVAEFIVGLREREAMAALAFELLILTAARSNEVLGAQWPEIDEMAKVWTVSPERMKGDREHQREHRVPLTTAALDVLKRAKALSGNDGYVFPGARDGRPLSNMAFEMLIRRMNGTTEPPIWRDHRGDVITPHGFRSTFKDWASECTNFPNEVSELALAHTIDDKTEAAYRRGDLFEKRRRMMDAWAKHCAIVRSPVRREIAA